MIGIMLKTSMKFLRLDFLSFTQTEEKQYDPKIFEFALKKRNSLWQFCSGKYSCISRLFTALDNTDKFSYPDKINIFVKCI